jgi:hypothetical protein
MSEGDPLYLGHRQRLRERFLKSGFEGFANYEVVELLLTLAIPRSDVKQPAKALVARFGNLRAILDAPIEELQAVKGLGSVTPAALKIIKAAATLYLQRRGGPGFARGSVATCEFLAHADHQGPLPLPEAVLIRPSVWGQVINKCAAFNRQISWRRRSAEFPEAERFQGPACTHS